MAEDQGPASESDGEWDDCDRDLSKPCETKPSRTQSKMTDFCIFDARIDGAKSGLVLSRHDYEQERLYPNLTIVHSTLPDLRLYDLGEEQELPKSFLIAASNRLHYSNVRSRLNSIPYFFYGAQMFPSILRDTAKMKCSLKAMTMNMTIAIVLGLRREAVQARSWPAAYSVQSSRGEEGVVGMLAFSIPQDARRSLESFQGGSSDRRLMRARFRVKDGSAYEIDCYVFVTQRQPQHRSEAREWRVTDLMRDQWHCQNLQLAEVEEQMLSRDACS